MDIPKLKQEAAEALGRAVYPPRRIVAIHTGATLALSLVLTAISWGLSSIEGTGGIGGLDTQAALSTGQTLLQLISSLAAPFWSAGLVFWAVSCVRQRDAQPRGLLEGFRRWGPILSSLLMMGLRYFFVGFISVYLSSFLLMLTPAALPVLEASQSLMATPSADLYTLLGDSLPMVFGWCAAMMLPVFALFALPLFYRWRMVSYIIMDDAKVGGMQAMMLSRAMTHRRKLELFRLDLSFWWYYALELLAVGLTYGGELLALAGVSIPGWCFAVLSILCQFGLYVWAKPRVSATYALAYEDFRQPRPAPAPKPQKPQNHPWNY